MLRLRALPPCFSSAGALAWVLAALLAPGLASAQTLFLPDSAGDDDGPGEYLYPTDEDYVPGSFDLTEMTLSLTARRATFEVRFAAPLQDPWGMGVGFSLQAVFIFIDHREGGQQEAPAGLNIRFAEDSAWETCIVLSPQQPARLQREIEKLADPLAQHLVVPERTRGHGSSITAQVRLADLGEGDPATWGYQVAILANDNLPAQGHLFTGRVEEVRGRHRFGGGDRLGCSPNVLDVLGDSEQLLYDCRPDGTARKAATLSMVLPDRYRAPPPASVRESEETLPEDGSQRPPL